MPTKAEIIEKVKQYVYTNRNALPSYFRINEDKQYLGWVSKLAVGLDGKKDSLDLAQEKDLFILFALAGAWSHTGPWENGAYFAAYLKNSDWTIEEWKSDAFCEKKASEAKKWAEDVSQQATTRRLLSFREEFCDTTHRLAMVWDDVKTALASAQQSADWLSFVNFLRNLKILKHGEKALRIKIPFILREMRCQKLYSNIPGELCCIADQRVKEAYESLFGKNLPTDYLKASAEIYKDWGDLYDMPLFSLVVDKMTGKRDLEVDLAK